MSVQQKLINIITAHKLLANRLTIHDRGLDAENTSMLVEALEHDIENFEGYTDKNTLSVQRSLRLEHMWETKYRLQGRTVLLAPATLTKWFWGDKGTMKVIADTIVDLNVE